MLDPSVEVPRTDIEFLTSIRAIKSRKMWLGGGGGGGKRKKKGGGGGGGGGEMNKGDV